MRSYAALAVSEFGLSHQISVHPHCILGPLTLAVHAGCWGVNRAKMKWEGCVQACTWVSSAALLVRWLKFQSPESVRAAPAVQTFPGDVLTGSQRKETPENLNTVLTRLLGSRILSCYLQCAIYHSVSWDYQHRITAFPHLQSFKAVPPFVKVIPALLKGTKLPEQCPFETNVHKDSFIAAPFDFLFHWSIWGQAGPSDNPILTH